jgi:hypothetical protein
LTRDKLGIRYEPMNANVAATAWSPEKLVMLFPLSVVLEAACNLHVSTEIGCEDPGASLRPTVPGRYAELATLVAKHECGQDDSDPLPDDDDDVGSLDPYALYESSAPPPVLEGPQS